MTILELSALAFLISVVMGVGAGLTHAAIVAYSIKGIGKPKGECIVIVLVSAKEKDEK